MAEQLIHDELSALAAVPGVRCCALVDAGSGLVWQACGEVPDSESLWEAAAEYWRLHRRLDAHFVALGPLVAAVLHHQTGVLVLMPCAAELDIVVACFASHRSVDWRDWQTRIAALGEKLKTL